MSVYTNQTNANTTTTFFGAGGGGGGSNFPSGITIGTNPNLYTLQPSINIAWGSNTLSVLDLSGSNQKDLGAGNIYSINGDGNSAKTGKYSGDGIFYQGSNGAGNGSRFLGVEDRQLNNTNTTSAFQIYNISSITGTMNTTDNEPNYNSLFFTLRPDQAVKGGSVYATFNYDAVDTGANVACRVGANSQTAYIGAEWLGYITMPMAVYGATVTVASDNETFFYMDGLEGRQGTISTGTAFISGSNEFSSITSADKVNTANMDALLSTLKSVYPDCFLP
jgi:hypothetical protein